MVLNGFDGGGRKLQCNPAVATCAGRAAGPAWMGRGAMRATAAPLIFIPVLWLCGARPMPTGLQEFVNRAQQASRISPAHCANVNSPWRWHAQLVPNTAIECTVHAHHCRSIHGACPPRPWQARCMRTTSTAMPCAAHARHGVHQGLLQATGAHHPFTMPTAVRAHLQGG